MNKAKLYWNKMSHGQRHAIETAFISMIVTCLILIMISLSYKTYATNDYWAIYVGDDKVGVVSSESAANEVIRDVESHFASKAASVEQISVQPSLSKKIVEENKSKKIKIDSSEGIVNKILTGGVDVKEHHVVAGDTLWSIASSYGISIDQLKEMNPDKNLDLILPGDKVIISSTRPMVSVHVVQRVTTKESIEQSTRYESSAELYEDEEQVKEQGAAGVKKIVTRQTKENDRVIANEVISQEVIKEPVERVVVKGTKNRFRYPLGGMISSPFGMRIHPVTGAYSMHTGIDITGSYGATITASSGGRVSFTGYKGGYGNTVIIDHGNGYKTLYAHCSSISVSVGTTVKQGQAIAAVGTSGVATGPHLHFEIIKNGSPIDPQSMLR